MHNRGSKRWGPGNAPLDWWFTSIAFMPKWSRPSDDEESWHSHPIDSSKSEIDGNSTRRKWRFRRIQAVPFWMFKSRCTADGMPHKKPARPHPALSKTPVAAALRTAIAIAEGQNPGERIASTNTHASCHPFPLSLPSKRRLLVRVGSFHHVCGSVLLSFLYSGADTFWSAWPTPRNLTSLQAASQWQSNYLSPASEARKVHKNQNKLNLEVQGWQKQCKISGQ